MEKIVFKLEAEEASQGSENEVAFYVLEQTRIGGTDYILVTTSEEEEDGEALILKEVRSERKPETDSGKKSKSNPKLKSNEEADSLYEIVEDETELHAVAAVFGNLLEDTTLFGEE